MEQAAAGRSIGIFGFASTTAVALLPKLTCPLCWPVYTAALAALGLSFVNYTPYLLPITAFFVIVALASLAWTTRKRGIVPLLVGAIAGAALLFGKFVLESDALTYAAMIPFVIAPFLPMRRPGRPACARCTSVTSKETVP